MVRQEDEKLIRDMLREATPEGIKSLRAILPDDQEWQDLISQLCRAIALEELAKLSKDDQGQIIREVLAEIKDTTPRR
jgi:hypothetical protein